MPIGVFSGMTRISVRTLRRYDASGLLSAAEVDHSTGYRYYAADQAARAETIRSLRAIGMSLEQIGVLLDNPSQDVIAEVLRKRRAELTADLERTEQMLARTQRLLSGEETLMPYAITTSVADDSSVLSVRRHANAQTIASVIAEGFAEVVKASGGAIAAPPFVVFHDVIDEDTEGEVEICLPVATGTRGAVVLPGATTVATVHQGPYENIAPAYHALALWMGRHGHVPAAPPREIYLNDPTTVEPAAIRTRVEWPISKEE